MKQSKLFVQALDDSIVDVEDFRNKVQDACRQFTKSERNIIAALTCDKYDGYDFLIEWQAHIVPAIRDVRQLHDKPALMQLMAKQLHASNEKLVELMNPVVTAQIDSLRKDFIRQYYEGVTAKQWKRIRTFAEKNLFNYTDSDIGALCTHAAQYRAYTSVARRVHVSFVDPVDGFLQRHRAKAMVRREIKTYSKTLKQRRSYTAYRLAQLSGMYDGIIEELIRYEWNIAVIVSLRNKYEKEIGTVSRETLQTHLQRHDVFERISHDFIHAQAKKHITIKNSATDIQTVINEMRILLIRVFELSVVQKNRLLACNREYVDLAKENKRIERTR